MSASLSRTGEEEFLEEHRIRGVEGKRVLKAGLVLKVNLLGF